MSYQQDFAMDMLIRIKNACATHGYAECCAYAITAQACLESAYGKSKLASKYHNYFGMKCGSSWKGKSVNLSTNEEYTVGVYTNIKANFRVYDTIEEGIEGYFVFISTSRYSNLKSATSAEDYLTKIKADGYATSSKYVANNMAVVKKIISWEGTTSIDTSINYYPAYTGSTTSIVSALKSLGVDSSFSHRKQIAKVNGFSSYLGTAKQNTALLALLKQGKLIHE